jgi:exonuclease-1
MLVDASCLLHRGLFGCASKIALGQETQLFLSSIKPSLITVYSYIDYVKKYINFLLAQKCHVILVFDGRQLPAKKSCNDSRRETRKEYQQQGIELMSQGLTSEAWKAFSRGTELTPEIIKKTIRVRKKNNKNNFFWHVYFRHSIVSIKLTSSLPHMKRMHKLHI